MANRNKKGRRVNGVLLLDKPLNMSSNQALQKIKRLYSAQKAGHTGSLDPLATGMLPICLGEATKISAYLLDANKIYRFKCQLGTRTATADAEGEVIETCDFQHVTARQVEKILSGFVGDIKQVPPMYSALKKDGRRLYELARKGESVERQPRPVTIFDLHLLAFENGELTLEVKCSKGTYVRTLAEDIAQELGTCAYVTELRRLSVEPYEQTMLSMRDVETLAEQGFDQLDEQLLAVDSGIASWPKVNLDEDSAYYIKLGQPVQVARAPTQGLVRIYSEDEFLGVGSIADDGKVAPKRMLANQ